MIFSDDEYKKWDGKRMFTGIIEDVGIIKSIKRGAKSCVLEIASKVVTEETKNGDSIAVNGVCLTVTTMGSGTFTADVMAETMRRTSFADLRPGSGVNLERAMRLGDRFGGHIVSGHIDGTGTISGIRKEDNAVWITVETSKDILKYIVEKGSITIDGISLTVAGIEKNSFSVSIIPHTRSSTTLMDKKVGAKVNLENDIVGKYVERLMSGSDVNKLYDDKVSANDRMSAYDNSSLKKSNAKKQTGGLTLDTMIENGFM